MVLACLWNVGQRMGGGGGQFPLSPFIRKVGLCAQVNVGREIRKESNSMWDRGVFTSSP